MEKQSWTKLFGGVPPTTATHVVDLDAALLAGVFGFVAGCAVVTVVDRLLWNMLGSGLLPDLLVIEHARFWMQGLSGGKDWTRYLGWLDALEGPLRQTSCRLENLIFRFRGNDESGLFQGIC